MNPILCYVTDRNSLGAESREEALLAKVREAVAAGVGWIQLREKDLEGRALGEWTRNCVSVARGSQTQVIVNDRLDVAVTCDAAGVHLGEESLPVRDVVEWCAQRREASDGPSKLAATFLIGRSCHSLEAARAAEADGASYIFFGPVFATPSKAKFGPAQGVDKLAEVCRSVRIPVVSIGGISLSNAAECFRAGAAGIAAIRMFQEAKDLRGIVSELRRITAGTKASM
jgi:thiamine-phosphate pyrophosphorylase